MKKIYIEILNSYCQIPLVKNEINFSKYDEKDLDNMIYNKVIPGTIKFYGDCIVNKKNYLDIINLLINNIKKSEKHFNHFKELIQKL